MLQLLRRCVRPLSFLLAGMFWVLSIDLAFLPVQPAMAAGNGVNVILMIGDGMGWEMARAAAIANGSYYTQGKGRGLNMQKLAGYTYATTYGTTIFDGTKFGTGNSALDGSSTLTGASPSVPAFPSSPCPSTPEQTPSPPPGAPPTPLWVIWLATTPNGAVPIPGRRLVRDCPRSRSISN